MKNLAWAVLLLVISAGCIGGESKTVSQVAPTEDDVLGATVEIHKVIAVKTGEVSPEAELEEQAQVSGELDLPQGLSAEPVDMDPGELPGLVEKGTYFIKKDGETVLMLIIGRFESEEKAAENYEDMKGNVRQSFTSTWPPGFEVQESTENIDLGPSCTAAKRTMTVTSPPPVFEVGPYVPPDYQPPEFEPQTATYSMQMAICQKGVFMIGMMNGSPDAGTDATVEMQAVSAAVLRKA